MERNKALVLATIGTMVCAATALGQDDYRSVQDGTWSTKATWEIDTGGGFGPLGEGQDVPGAGDNVLVRVGDVVQVNQAVQIATLQIEKDGVVSFASAHTLEVTAADGLTLDPMDGDTPAGKLEVTSGSGDRIVKLSGGSSTAHSIDGSIVLQGSTSFFDVVSNNASLGGAGNVTLENASASIRIADGVQMTIKPTFMVQGRGKIDRLGASGTGNLRNEGKVIANAIGTLELAANVMLTDQDNTGDEWQAVDNSSAVLLFSRAHECPNPLAGDFFVDDDATLQFDQDVDTAGDFNCAGSGNVTGTGTLTYNANCSGGGSTASGC